MSKLIDLTGETFGYLTVIGLDEEKRKEQLERKRKGKIKGVGTSHWICKCKCGNIISVSSSKLRRGEIKSCGCLRKEIASKKGRKHFDISLADFKPDLLKEWDYEKNKILPTEVAFKSNLYAWWKCSNGHSYQQIISDKTINNHKCIYCTNQKVLFGYNDVYTTNPEFRKYFVDINDAKTHTKGSGKIVKFKCPTCGYSKEIPIYRLTSKNYIYKFCPKCDDGLSLGSKLIYNLLELYNINFEREKSFSWSDNKLYDYYLFDYDTIIEVNGEQHKEEKNHVRYNGIKESDNDRYKLKLANENNIKNYITLPFYFCNKNKYIDTIYKSDLKNIIDLDVLTDDDWNELFVKSTKSIIFEVCDLYNQGYKIKEILNMTMIKSPTTIRSYLKYGTSINICNYYPNSNKSEVNNGLV